MKILIDECLPNDFRHCFPAHEVHSVQWARFKGKKNGELIRAAESAGYEVLLTVDQSIPHQQNSTTRRLSIVLIRSYTNQMEDLMPLVDSILEVLEIITPGESLPVG
jgi:predicted nuclease of predicted toxin-antitoxin system